MARRASPGLTVAVAGQYAGTSRRRGASGVIPKRCSHKGVSSITHILPISQRYTDLLAANDVVASVGSKADS